MVLFSFFMGTISSILTVTVMHSRTTVVSSSGNKVIRATRLAPGGTPYNGLYGEAPPERGTFFRL